MIIQISARQTDLIIIKMRTCRIVDFVVLADQRVKLKESKKKNKYRDLDWESKVEHESDGNTSCNWYS